MVLNSSSCSLNQGAWAPNVWLPQHTITWVLDFDYKTVDIDLGEIFTNFPFWQRSINNIVILYQSCASCQARGRWVRKGFRWSIISDREDLWYWGWWEPWWMWVSIPVHLILSDFASGLNNLSGEIVGATSIHCADQSPRGRDLWPNLSQSDEMGRFIWQSCRGSGVLRWWSLDLWLHGGACLGHSQASRSHQIPRCPTQAAVLYLVLDSATSAAPYISVQNITRSAIW